jgi:hypothetical protein
VALGDISVVGRTIRVIAIFLVHDSFGVEEERNLVLMILLDVSRKNKGLQRQRTAP